HRGKEAGQGDAGPDGLGKVASIKHHGVAGGNVGGHGAEGNRQPVEVVYVVGMDQQALQNQAQVLALQQAQRETQLAVLEGQPLLDQEVPVVLLAAVRNVLALGESLRAAGQSISRAMRSSSSAL